MDFLGTISAKNNGYATKIYEADDADSQLEAFFSRIQNPVCSEVNVD
jgi:hypothetical protein